jgi:glycosyltransferase involved in cell wall biosynthesis
MHARICFFAPVASRAMLDRAEFLALELRALRELGFEVHVATRLRELRPADVFYVWGWDGAALPMAYARLQRKPVVVAGVLNGADDDARSAGARWSVRHALAHADANLFASRADLERAVGLGARGRHVPLGVDTALYSPAGERDRSLVFSIAETDPANAERRCVAEMVTAATRVCRARSDARFVIAGELGGAYAALQREVDASGMRGRISFPGAVSREEKIRWMRRCAVYLQPTRHEGMGAALAEAMACGAAVVTSPAGVVSDLAGDAAVMVDGASSASIADAVERLLADRCLRAEYGRRARVRIDTRFPFERRRETIGAVLRQVLAPAAAPAPSAATVQPASM